ncbi:type II inositol 1,4,5-trisphosphate 5-phosphatase [Drosophila innubila]|uniref:type II inositol 1,4,5-trisphosphate 5-phosphatase n=1 Tax=Drosophila innubila TaxID=198719 RepID=UPI00148E3D78|nr:type II inositol 1,4,5-trisphosphate 5-phosphatase [Drosophila innubila]
MERGINFPNGDDGATASAPEKTTMELVQQRFKSDERVHLIFEAYQIKGPEHVEGLLTLVSSLSCGTYAIISFSPLRTPLRASNELKIDQVFPITKSFQLTKDTKGSITEQQFDLSTDDDGPIKYYYHTFKTDIESVDYEQFVAEVYSCKSLMWTAETLNFMWLDDYREIGDRKQELKKRLHQCIVYKDLIIYCATWNVNNKPCWDGSNESLRPWLARGKNSPDIYAIGLQEIEKMSKVMLNANQLQLQWVTRMLSNLHDGNEYEEYKTVRLSTMMLTIIVRKRLSKYILRSRINSVARGVLNTFGNKGGVAVSLEFKDASICFINSHLAAHMDYIVERNEDYKGIEEGIKFGDDGGPYRTINDHDHVFWLGDLNYRISKSDQISDCNILDLRLQRDQLLDEMSKGNCFNGYTEGQIRFEPTYKYEPGSDRYDTQREPAYCDRVLWKGRRIEQMTYNSVMEIRQSDHKPVYAIFKIKLKTCDENKLKREHEKWLKDEDKRENESQPQIVADPILIDFGLVRFNELVIRDFKVSNKWVKQVDFLFKVQPSLNGICEKYVHVDPRDASLLVESERFISIKLMIDPKSVSSLLKKICDTKSKFDFDVLILHVKDGRDIFITATGKYQPSCFGLSMETMCRTDRPISEYSQEEMRSMILDVSPEYRVTMPREFFLLIDYLHKQGDSLRDLFQSYDRRQLLSSQFNAVRDWLDTWSEEEFPGTPQTAAEALLLLLDLPEQAVLEPFVDDLMMCKSKSEAMELIALLSPPKRNVFMHLCMFLREGVERNNYELSNVAAIFGRILLRSSKSNITTDYQNRCTEFMRRFIIETADPVAGGNGQRVATGAGLQT